MTLAKALLGAALCAVLTFAAPAAQADEPAWMFDPTAVVEIDLDLSQASRDALAIEPGEYVDATFSLTGAGGSYGPLAIGVRLKGSASFRPLSGKAAFKLKFSHSVPGQRFLGLKALTLNNMVQDHSMVREVLAYDAFRAVGLAAPRAGYAYVRVNGDDYGVYLNVETPDSVFLSKWFSSTGHLYEGEHVDLAPGAAETFEVDEGSKSDRGDLERLIAAVNGPTEGWLARVAPAADLDAMTRMWAVEKYIGHWDGYVGNLNNFYLHSDAAGQFSMLPWGTDQTWFRRSPFGTAEAQGRMFTGCLADPTCELMYREALDDARATISGLDLEEKVTTVADVLEPWQLRDPRREYSVQEIEAAVTGVLGFLDVRPQDTNWNGASPGGGSDGPGTTPSPTQTPSPTGGASPTQTPSQPDTMWALGEWARATGGHVGALVRREGLRGLANGFSHMLRSDWDGVAIEEVLAPTFSRQPAAGSGTARRIVVARGVKRFPGPARSRIFVRPTKAARHTLRGRKALKLVVRITFDPAGSERSIVRSTTVRVGPRSWRSRSGSHPTR